MKVSNKMASKSKKIVRKHTARFNLEDTILDSVLTIIRKNDKIWIGTMTALSEAIERLNKNNAKKLPASPSSLRVVLNRVANRLRNRKVSVRFGRTTDHTRTRYVRFSSR
jgi:hypothetical protein